MKKSIITLALVLLLASIVNQTVRVTAGGSSRQERADRIHEFASNLKLWADGRDSFKGPQKEQEIPVSQTSPPSRPSPTRTTTPPTTSPPETTEETSPATTSVTTATRAKTSNKTSKQTTTTSRPATTASSPPPVTEVSATSTAGATTVPNGCYCADFEAEVVRLVNLERAAAGAGPVTMNSSLRSSAAVRALEIIKKFSHERPNGTRWVTCIKLKYVCAGENLAAGQRTPASVVNAWMGSDGHRKNLLNPKFTDIGVACYHDPGASHKYYWVQIFAGFGN